MLTLLAFLITIVVIIVRIFAYKLRKRNWNAFMAHLTVLYGFNISKFIFGAYLKYKDLPAETVDTEKFVIIELAQRQITGAFALHVVLLAPKFSVVFIYFFSMYLQEILLISAILSPGTEEFTQAIVRNASWRWPSFFMVYVIFHREIKRHVISRRSNLKSQ